MTAGTDLHHLAGVTPTEPQPAQNHAILPALQREAGHDHPRERVTRDDLQSLLRVIVPDSGYAPIVRMARNGRPPIRIWAGGEFILVWTC